MKQESKNKVFLEKNCMFLFQNLQFCGIYLHKKNLEGYIPNIKNPFLWAMELCMICVFSLYLAVLFGIRMNLFYNNNKKENKI